MEHGAAIRKAVRQLRALVRQRRAAYYGIRGLTWGLVLAIFPVALRAFLPDWAALAAGALAAGGAVAGVLVGAGRRVPAAEAAGVADRAFAFHDRLRTALELAAAGPEDGMPEAAVRDAARRVQELDLRRAVPWRWPREVRMLPVPVLALAVLPYLPPIPVPEVRVPSVTPVGEEAAKAEERAQAAQSSERPLARKPEEAQRVEMQEKDYRVRPNPEREQARGELAASFKDTSVASKRPDFSSFLKQGDERLRLLERMDSLPDLQRDFTQSEYKVMFRRSRELLGGGDPRQMSKERMRQLLEEMDRLGRRAGSPGGGGPGDWSQDVMEGSEALEQGQMSRALDAMERALGKMRAAEERSQAGKGLQGGKDQAGRGRDGAGGPGENEGDFGEGQGSFPGKGTNPGWRGDPTGRLGQAPIDMGVEGQARKGRREAYDTNMVGRGAQNPSRLPTLSVLSQYRKLMEDALAKESIPLDYRTHVKEYFQSLEER
jgi:hypothetical protein